MPQLKKRTIKPIKVKGPKDLPEVKLPPLEIKPVDVPKPPPPDVSTSFFEEAWAGLRLTLQKIVKAGGVDIAAMIKIPDTVYKILILLGVLIVVVVIPAIFLKAC